MAEIRLRGYNGGMAQGIRSGGEIILGRINPGVLCQLDAARLMRSSFFTMAMIAHVGLIKDGKIGAGQIRAAKIQQVIGYTEGV